MTVAGENGLGELDASRQKALAALLGRRTIAEAAKACKLSEATLFRYLREPTFKAHYRRARAEVVEHAIAQLQHDCAAATKSLREVCASKKAPASARVAAAKAILDGAVKGVELEDLRERVEALEEMLKG